MKYETKLSWLSWRFHFLTWLSERYTRPEFNLSFTEYEYAPVMLGEHLDQNNERCKEWAFNKTSKRDQQGWRNSPSWTSSGPTSPGPLPSPQRRSCRDQKKGSHDKKDWNICTTIYFFLRRFIILQVKNNSKAFTDKFFFLLNVMEIFWNNLLTEIIARPVTKWDRQSDRVTDCCNC